MNSRRLIGSVVPVDALVEAEVEALYALCAELYDGVSEARFRADLEEKDWVLLLRDGDSGAIRGLSTILLMDVEMQGEALRVAFSGDTGIDPAYWGGQALVRTWAQFMGELRAQEPSTRLYWFLISKGFRTYLYLPYFFHEFFPRWDRPTPPFEHDLIDTLGRRKYAEDFNPATGLVEFAATHGHLTPALADIPPRRLCDPHVRFFLARNPGYARGHELVCVAELSESNMKGLARRMLLEGRRELLVAS